MITITLFGSMRASLNDASGSQVLSPTHRVAEMLAFLAVHRGRYFSRTELAQVMKGHDECGATEGSVNTILWRLRRIIEPTPGQRGVYLNNARSGKVGLNGPERVKVDIEEFKSRVFIDTLKPLEAITETDCNTLRSGLSMYCDDVLGEFKAPWAATERERLRAMFFDAAVRLMHHHERLHQYADAIHYARAILRIDPLREDTHRDLMRYYVYSGQRPLALLQFEDCRTALRRDLAIQPMPETMALYRQIADGATTRLRRP